MDAAHPNVFIPPRPPIPARELTFFSFLRAIRTNALGMWTEAAYQEDVLVRRVLGHSQMLINAPDAIHRVLVENHANYRRSPASIRILRPITGNGLLLSDGEEWRHQRRTIAPALAPRTLPMLARHIVDLRAGGGHHASGRRPTSRSICSPPCRTWRSTSPAARCSRWRCAQYGAAMRRLLTEYGREATRKPHLLDMVLPPSIPTLRDFGRRRFQRRWMAFMAGDHASASRRAAPRIRRATCSICCARRAIRKPARASRPPSCAIRCDDDPGRARDHGGDAVLVAGPAERCARRAAARRRGGMWAWRSRRITPMDVMPRLVRTRAVISETLRLYPPAFALAREAIGPDRAGAIDIPRGAVLMIAPWVLHRHRRLWRDPDAFDPSRFLPDAPPTATLCLSAVRRRPARLRRRSVRTRRGDAGAGDDDPEFRGGAGRSHAGAAGGDRD